MNPISLIVLILVVLIFYLQIRKYQNVNPPTPPIPPIPKNFKKVLLKYNDTPNGVLELVNQINETSTNKSIIESFTDIKDIRYGKIGCNNCANGVTKGYWIKLAKINLNGAWNEKGFTLEIYPKTRHHGSSRQTIVCLARNNTTDLEEPYISLTTHNEAKSDSSTFRDIKAIRVGGSGTSNNVVEFWGQFAGNQSDNIYSMFYLYGIDIKDEIVTTKSTMIAGIPQGVNWGVNEIYSPTLEQRNVNGGARKTLKNSSNNPGAYALQSIETPAGRSFWFINSGNRQEDGGPKTATLRNDSGDMRLQGATSGYEDKGIIVKGSSGNVGINTKNPRSTLEVNGDINFTGKLLKKGNVFSSNKPVQEGAFTGGVGTSIGFDSNFMKIRMRGQLGSGVINQTDNTISLSLLNTPNNLGNPISWVHTTDRNATTQSIIIGATTSGLVCEIDIEVFVSKNPVTNLVLIYGTYRTVSTNGPAFSLNNKINPCLGRVDLPLNKLQYNLIPKFGKDTNIAYVFEKLD